MCSSAPDPEMWIIQGALFFFSSRRRHTSFSRDWSSDVCSSDLLLYTLASVVVVTLLCGLLPALRTAGGLAVLRGGAARAQVSTRNPLQWLLVGAQVDRKSACRERVCVAVGAGQIRAED